jgi:hypothetical protein
MNVVVVNEAKFLEGVHEVHEKNALAIASCR